jgi:preprotein translocase subunit SecG
MEEVILVVHMFLALAIIGLVLLQRSEGGGLGIGGGGGLGGLATPQGAANLLTKMTAICAGLFFLTSLILGIMAGQDSKGRISLGDALQNAPSAQEAPLATEVPAPVDAPAPQTETPPESTPSVPIAQ